MYSITQPTTANIYENVGLPTDRTHLCPGGLLRVNILASNVAPVLHHSGPLKGGA